MTVANIRHGSMSSCALDLDPMTIRLLLLTPVDRRHCELPLRSEHQTTRFLHPKTVQLDPPTLDDDDELLDLESPDDLETPDDLDLNTPHVGRHL